MSTVNAYKASLTRVDDGITTSQDEYIHDYSQETLSAYEDAGFTAIAEMDDGTEQAVPWSSVACPAKEPTISERAVYVSGPMRNLDASQSKSKGASDDCTSVFSPNGTLMMRVFDDRVEVIGDLVINGAISQKEHDAK